MKIGERNDNDNQNPLIISNLIWTSCSTNSLPSRGKEKKQMGQIVGTVDSQDIEIVGCERKTAFSFVNVYQVVCTDLVNICRTWHKVGVR